MKKNYVNIAKTLAFTMFAFSVSAQVADKKISEKSLNNNGTPGLIQFNESASYKTANPKKVFTDQLKLKSNENFISTKVEQDLLGFKHEKFQLFHQGVKVEFATYTLHSKNEKVQSMSGEYYDLKNVSVSPKLSPSDAFAIAKNHIGASSYLWENASEAKAMEYKKPIGELVLLPSMEQIGEKRTTDEVTLAYKFDMYASKPLSRGDLYIDAKTGSVLFYNATIKHLGEHAHGNANTKKAFTKSIENTNSFELFKKNNMMVVAGNAATRYSGTRSIQTTLSGSSYILSDNTRGSGVITYNSKKLATYTNVSNFTDVNNDWTAAEFDNANKDNGALDAHWGAEKTYDYWSTIHGRNSYNNSGAAIKSYVHYNLVAAGQPSNNNAFWNGSVMTYGDGTGTGGFDILTALDVCGHEIGHAVCSNTANLAYQKESGAMNEGFSDIWGACIEYFSEPTKQIWLIGEDIERRSGHLALRSMSDPNSEGQPDTYGGTYWKTVSCTPSNTNDYCGVHTNSGVLNHWFYILAVGKSGTNDIGNAFNVTGITIEKAQKIAYRLETVYLSANSTFANARTGGIQAATDLYGAGSAEVIATTNAWFAVGVGAAYAGTPTGDTTAPSAPTSLVASGTTSSTTNLAWNASTDNVAVTAYDVYRGTTLLGSTTATVRTYTVTGLTASTAYTFTVKAKDAAGNVSVASNTASVTTLAGSPPPTTTYCTSKGNSVADEWIDYVALNGMTNTTGANAGYANFTATKIAPLPYGANTITFSAGFKSTAYTEYWAVWVDFNKNGTFESSELVVSGSSSSSANLTGTITVPTTALAGNTRMRVSMKYNAAQTACETFSYGEVEDYTVTIGGAALTSFAGDVSQIGNEGNVFEFDMYPNPTTTVLNIAMTDNRKASYVIYNFMGQRLKAETNLQNEINVADLAAGVYIIEVNDGQKAIAKKFIKN